MSDPFSIKVWCQMFFDDGSVTQGLRVDASVLDDDKDIDNVAEKLLDSVNRNTGFLLIWGAGNVLFLKYPRFISSSPMESNSLVS